MVHAITFLKCKKGHLLPIGYDSNECGCHHRGRPTIIISCPECYKEFQEKCKKNPDLSFKDCNIYFGKMEISLDEQGKKEVEKLLK